MKKAPQVISAEKLREDWPLTAIHDEFTESHERALQRPAAPYAARGLRARARAAWLVFTGKADALMWRGQ
jgi:hypothetical protein